MENGTAAPSSSYQLTATPWIQQMLTLSLCVIIIIAILGNLIVVMVFYTHKPLFKITNSFIISLAVSDMLVSTVNMPAWIVKIIWDCAFNKMLQDVWVCMDIAVGVASILSLTAVSACRYIQVTQPYKYAETVTKHRVIASLLSIWVFSITIAVVKRLIPQNPDVWYYQPCYQLLVFFISCVIPLAGISYCYFHMFKEVSRQQGHIPKVHSQHQKRSLVNDIKAIKTIAIVVVMLVVCWCPFFIVVLANAFCKCVTNVYLIIFVKILKYSNSALNPIIYVWYNREYRKAFINALRKFAHHHGAQFVIDFLYENIGERKSKVVEKVVLLRS